MNARATFKRMDECTKADWDIIVPEAIQYARALPERVLAHLKLLQGDYGGFPIDRYSHCLQTATLALRDGRDQEYVVTQHARPLQRPRALRSRGRVRGTV
jgi:predicted HD phosphohydrolase